MSMELKKYRLSEIIETFIPGDWGEESSSSEYPNAVRCVRGADIVPIWNSDYDHIPIRYISNRSFANKQLKVGDIIIEKSGGSPTQSTGRTAFVSEELIRNATHLVCTNFCTAFRIKPGWNSKYVYYYLQHLYNNDVFFNFEGKTSGLKNLQIENAFDKATITQIPIEKQNQIVEVLDTLDCKIALNRAINRNLEALAKQLYDYWFVQFDFPDGNGRPYKSSGGKMVWNEVLKREVPERWVACRIKDFLRIFTGKKDVSKAIPGDYKFFSCAPDPITSNEYIYDGAAILVSGNGSYTGRVSFYKGKFDLYQRTYACVPIKDDNAISFFFYTLRYLFQPAFSGGKHGSSIPYIVLGDLADFSFAYDERQVIEFVRIVKSMFDLQMKKRDEIGDLIRQRDELLPLLMNGQVTID